MKINEIAIIAKKYNRKIDFKNGNNRAYRWALRLKIMDKITKHMIPTSRIKSEMNKLYTKKKCLAIARKYKKRSDFHKKHHGAYKACKREGWYVEATEHMKSPNVLRSEGKTKWTKSILRNELKGCKSIGDIRRTKPLVYSAILRHELKDELLGNIKRDKMPNGYWNKDLVLKEARRYKTLKEFYTNSNAAYKAAYNHGLIYEVDKILKRHLFVARRGTKPFLQKITDMMVIQ